MNVERYKEFILTKRLIAVLWVAVLAFSLTACGGSKWELRAVGTVNLY